MSVEGKGLVLFKDLRIKAQGLVRIQGAWSLGGRVPGSVFRIQGSGFRVQG